MYTVVYLLAIAWPVSYGVDFVQKNWVLALTWALACASMSVFTVLPANKVEDPKLMYVRYVLLLIALTDVKQSVRRIPHAHAWDFVYHI